MALIGEGAQVSSKIETMNAVEQFNESCPW